MNQLLKPCALLASALLFGTAAHAQMDISGTTTTGTVSADRDLVTVELKPLPTLLSVVPGVGSIGAGVEGKMTPATAAFLDAYFLSSNLPERIDNTAKERSDNQLYPEKLWGNAADLGARFYGSPVGSTWYTGVKIGFASQRGEYSYKDERVEAKSSSMTPGLQAGYRWAWHNDVIVRLGGSVAANLVQTKEYNRKTEGPNVQKAEDKIDERVKTPVLANVDLGLGYQF